MDKIKNAAAMLGRKGGLAKSERKAASSAENGRKGGKPSNEELDITYAGYKKIIEEKYSDLIKGIYKAADAVAGLKLPYGVDYLGAFIDEMKKLGFSEKDFPRFTELEKLVFESYYYRQNSDGKYRTQGPFEEENSRLGIDAYCRVFVNCFNDPSPEYPNDNVFEKMGGKNA